MQSSPPDSPEPSNCKFAELTSSYALQALPESEVDAAEAHAASCPECHRELETLRPAVAGFTAWPTDILRPTTSLRGRLALRLAEETGQRLTRPPAKQWMEPEWKHVAPGIECKLLATDAQRHRVSMLVRLAATASYPAHTHADFEELHLLDGELWIDECKLIPGDYYSASAGTADHHVWSATGCTCLLATSTKDVLG